MLATKSHELDKILLDYPRIRQTDAVENSEFIRFTVELQIDPTDHPNPPCLFLLFMQNEFTDARTNGTLESQLREKVVSASFKDALNGQQVRTSLRKGPDGIWVAVTVDGSIWAFDVGQNRWIKGPISL